MNQGKGSGDDDEEMSYNDFYSIEHQEYQEYSCTCNRFISLVIVKMIHF